MITLLWYLVVAALIAGVVFAVTLVVFGRGEQLSPLPPRTSPSELPPAGLVEGAHVKGLRLGVAVRGYRMSDVDWTLDRLQEELDLVRAEQDRLRALVVDLGGDPTPPAPATTDLLTGAQDAASEEPSEVSDEAASSELGSTADRSVGVAVTSQVPDSSATVTQPSDDSAGPGPERRD